MTKHVANKENFYHEYFVYDGNTGIERIKKFSGNRIVRDWLRFNSAEEAMDYFNNDIE